MIFQHVYYCIETFIYIFGNCDITKINSLKWVAFNELRIFQRQKKSMNTDRIFCKKSVFDLPRLLHAGNMKGILIAFVQPTCIVS